MANTPHGVNSMRKYSLSFGKGTILGVVHHESYPPTVVDYLQNDLHMSVDAFCLEAPKGILDIPDHNIAKVYKDRSRTDCKIIPIDRKPAQYDGGNEYIDDLMNDGYKKDIVGASADGSRNATEEELGKTEKNSPEWAEVNREREQMMAFEIIDAHNEGFNTIVTIVGMAHAHELVSQLRTIDNKYS